MNQIYFSVNIFELIIAGILALLFVILIFCLFIVYLRPYRERKTNPGGNLSESRPPVSVIVYAKNESVNLKENLPLLLQQDYPVYEVIVVNDGSTDESEDVLSQLEVEYKNLYHTFIPQESRYLSRKKLALTVGIKAAKNDILLFIEPNCKPLTNWWIYRMVQSYNKPGIEVVLGYCAYRRVNGFLHKLASYDNLVTGLQYLSGAIRRRPFKGNGQNLSYCKELFFTNKGFSNSLKLHAGDDDLFINTCATCKNTQVEYSPESITEVEPVSRFSVWKEMKVSRAATQHHYRRGSLLPYRFEAFVYILYLLLSLFSVVADIQGNLFLPVTGLSLFLVYYCIKGIVFRLSARMLQQPSVSNWLLFLDIILFFMNLYVRVYRIFRGKNDYTFRVQGKNR